MNTYLLCYIMHFYLHILPLSFICLLRTFYPVRAMNPCDLPIGPLHNPRYSNYTNFRVTYATGVEEVDFYMEETRYEIFLTAEVKFTQSLVQVRDNKVGTIIGNFSFVPESNNTYFSLHSCNSTDNTFTSNGILFTAIQVLWISPDFTPANNVTFYYSLTHEDGRQDNNLIGTTLLALPTKPTSLALSLISNPLLIPLLLAVMFLA